MASGTSTTTTFGSGAIAGIVVGILVLGGIAALSVVGLLWYLRRRRARRAADERARLDAEANEGTEYEPIGGRHELGGMDKAELDKARAVEVQGEHIRELHSEAIPHEAGGQAVHELDAGMEPAELEASIKRS